MDQAGKKEERGRFCSEVLDPCVEQVLDLVLGHAQQAQVEHRLNSSTISQPSALRSSPTKSPLTICQQVMTTSHSKGVS
jgi:hypothetical protein